MEDWQKAMRCKIDGATGCLANIPAACVCRQMPSPICTCEEPHDRPYWRCEKHGDVSVDQ